MEQKSKTYIRPSIIIMIFVFLTIGYAYLTASLNINGSTLIGTPVWDVHFENVQVNEGSVTGEQVTQEPLIDTNKTTVSFHVNLKKPGDYYEFTVDAVNAGTIDAMINTYTEFDLTADQLKYLDTSVTYEDGEEIAEKQQLLAGDFAVYKIVVSFKKDLSADDLPDSPDELDLEFTVEYVQKDDTSIERKAETNSLYYVLKKETESGSGLAKLYTGDHQDSMDVSKSTRNIYHWYGSSDTDGETIKNKFNVLFAGHCWIIIRTTDTGGVKLVYNGLAQGNSCSTTRKNNRNNIDFSDYTDLANLSDNYYYSSDFSFNSGTKLFSLSGDIIQDNWNGVSSLDDIYGKYTCRSTNPDDTCSNLYYVIGPMIDPRYKKALIIKAYTSYSAFGTLPYNKEESSPSNVGYMYGDEHKVIQGYISNFSAASRVVWDGQKYILSSFSSSDFNSHHYFCSLLSNESECSTLGFIFYKGDDIISYTRLRNGVTSIEETNDGMFMNNVNESPIKYGVDMWYKRYLYSYSNYLEDTIYCNNRSIANYGGWKSNGCTNSSCLLLFNGSNYDSSLLCDNIYDRFSTKNNYAKLKYPVGLLTQEEMLAFNNNSLRSESGQYWTMTPNSFISSTVISTSPAGSVSTIFGNGVISGSKLALPQGVRPVVSLKPGTLFESGDGSRLNPYYIKTE